MSTHSPNRERATPVKGHVFTGLAVPLPVKAEAFSVIGGGDAPSGDSTRPTSELPWGDHAPGEAGIANNPGFLGVLVYAFPCAILYTIALMHRFHELMILVITKAGRKRQLLLERTSLPCLGQASV
jgi:hypothetical protein